MGHLVRDREDLTPKGHVGVDDDREACLRVVVEQPGWSTVQILAKRKAPDEDVLVGDPERIAQRSATQVQMPAKLASSVGGITCGRCRDCGEGALPLTGRGW